MKPLRLPEDDPKIKTREYVVEEMNTWGLHQFDAGFFGGFLTGVFISSVAWLFYWL